MAQENFNVSLPNDGLGDALRDAFVKQQNMNTELYDTKVDEVIGKDLSSNDFTDELKDKLDNIQDFAEANVQSDWLQGDTDADDYIKNKPENFISYPYKAIFPFVDGNVFTMPDGVAVSDVRPNGNGSDIGWTQVGTTLNFTSYTLVADDFLVVIGFFNPANVFSPTGGGVQTITSTDLAIGVDDSDPENIVLNFGGVVTDGTTINGSGTSLDPLVVIGGGGGADPSLITKFTSNPIPSIVGTDILVPEDETWLIDSVPYTNPTVSTIPFSYAPDGLLYFLTVVATKLNTFIGKFGTASTDPSEPIVNNDELFLTTYLISDGTVDVVVPPVSPNIYVEKESFAPLNFISSGYVASIELDKRNNIILSGTIAKTGNVIKNNSNHFVIGLPFTTTNKTANPIEIQHLNTSGGSGSVAYFNPEELSYFLQPNEVAIWISEILNGQKIHRRVSSYIDRDNVIFRSGTEAGKHVTGDVEIGDGISLATEEVNGTKSLLKSKNGKWQIEIEDGINSSLTLFGADKGILSNKLFDIHNDEKAYIQKGHIVQLEEDVFNLELNKADLVGGLVPSSQLPAYVDDIIEGYLFSGVFYKENTHTTAITGEIGKIYVDLTTGQKSRQYRWSGTVYIQITNGLIASTDDVPEGSNLYFTTARVLSTLLTGLSLVTGGAIVSTDSVLVAFGKVQKQINDIGTALGLKQDALTDTNFGTFTNSVGNKETQADTDVLAYVDVTTGKWVKQTFSKLVDYLKSFFVDKTTAQSIDGIKTFTASPIVPTATSDSHAINFGQAKGLGKIHAILIDNNIGDIVQHTGTTMSTIVKAYTIPAGFFTSDCVFETDLTISKIGTAGNIAIGFGIAPSGTTLPIHLVVTTAGNRYINIGRKMTMIKNGLIVGFGTSGGFYTDKIANGALMNKASTFNHTISNTFNLSIQLGDASDIALLENLTIKVYKNA